MVIIVLSRVGEKFVLLVSGSYQSTTKQMIDQRDILLSLKIKMLQKANDLLNYMP